MPPRIRSLLPRLPFARAKQAQAADAPRVFRDFVETLQRLDAAASAPPERRSLARRRRYLGNGHKRPRSRSKNPSP
jgi:hypothetical protein